MTGFNIYNEIVGILAGIVTTFLIPWLNKRFRLDVPDTPQTSEEIQHMIDGLLNRSTPVMPANPPITDLGSNPFTSALKPPPNRPEVTPPEDGAK